MNVLTVCTCPVPDSAQTRPEQRQSAGPRQYHFHADVPAVVYEPITPPQSPTQARQQNLPGMTHDIESLSLTPQESVSPSGVKERQKNLPPVTHGIESLSARPTRRVSPYRVKEDQEDLPPVTHGIESLSLRPARKVSPLAVKEGQKNLPPVTHSIESSSLTPQRRVSPFGVKEGQKNLPPVTHGIESLSLTPIRRVSPFRVEEEQENLPPVTVGTDSPSLTPQQRERPVGMEGGQESLPPVIHDSGARSFALEQRESQHGVPRGREPLRLVTHTRETGGSSATLQRESPHGITRPPETGGEGTFLRLLTVVQRWFGDKYVPKKRVATLDRTAPMMSRQQELEVLSRVPSHEKVMDHLLQLPTPRAGHTGYGQSSWYVQPSERSSPWRYEDSDWWDEEETILVEQQNELIEKINKETDKRRKVQMIWELLDDFHNNYLLTENRLHGVQEEFEREAFPAYHALSSQPRHLLNDKALELLEDYDEWVTRLNRDVDSLQQSIDLIEDEIVQWVTYVQNCEEELREGAESFPSTKPGRDDIPVKIKEKGRGGRGGRKEETEVADTLPWVESTSSPAFRSDMLRRMYPYRRLQGQCTSSDPDDSVPLPHVRPACTALKSQSDLLQYLHELVLDPRESGEVKRNALQILRTMSPPTTPVPDFTSGLVSSTVRHPIRAPAFSTVPVPPGDSALVPQPDSGPAVGYSVERSSEPSFEAVDLTVRRIPAVEPNLPTADKSDVQLQAREEPPAENLNGQCEPVPLGNPPDVHPAANLDMIEGSHSTAESDVGVSIPVPVSASNPEESAESDVRLQPPGEALILIVGRPPEAEQEHSRQSPNSDVLEHVEEGMNPDMIRNDQTASAVVVEEDSQAAPIAGGVDSSGGALYPARGLEETERTSPTHTGPEQHVPCKKPKLAISTLVVVTEDTQVPPIAGAVDTAFQGTSDPHGSESIDSELGSPELQTPRKKLKR